MSRLEKLSILHLLNLTPSYCVFIFDNFYALTKKVAKSANR